MIIDLKFNTPKGKDAVSFGSTAFGLVGVRMAKTIGVHDGGGRILNSEGQRDEKGAFRKPARWVDYSGLTSAGANSTGGITLMDHPGNPQFPSPFHVRNDGWMGACLTFAEPITVTKEKPLVVRYGLWIHAGVPTREVAQAKWKAFAALPVQPAGKPAR